jgi:hypothetical protein
LFSEQSAWGSQPPTTHHSRFIAIGTAIALDRTCVRAVAKTFSDSPSRIMKKNQTQMTISTEIKLLPQIEGRTNPFRRLAAAVISQAVKDATHQMGSDRKSATTWLLQDVDGFPFWCNVLGMDPDQTRQELSNLLGSPIK